MLNPSTADAFKDDPTIRKCIGFAMNAQCGGIDVVNLFALRSTVPHSLMTAPDPVGPRNDYWIERVITDRRCWRVVAAWGCDPHTWSRDVLAQRPHAVANLIEAVKPLYCLGLTRKGSPRHPSRLAYATPFELLPPRSSEYVGTPAPCTTPTTKDDAD